MIKLTKRYFPAPTYTGAGGVKPDEVTPEVIERMNSIAKIAYQLIYGVQGKDPLAVFDKRPVDKGKPVEQMVVELARSQAFNPDAEDVFKPNFVPPKVYYFNDYTQAQYSTSVSYNDIRKVLENENSEQSVAEMLVSSLAQGDVDEKFQNAKGLLAYGATNSLITKVGETINVTAEGGYKSLLKAIKNTVKGFTFVSDKFNKTNGGLRTRTNPDNIRIIAPYDIITDLDVDELSGVFNLDRAEIRNRIIETDAIDDKKIYIVDINAIMIFTRLYLMTDQLNAKGLFHNYWLTVDRMYAISPLFNSAYIEYNRGE